MQLDEPQSPYVAEAKTRRCREVLRRFVAWSEQVNAHTARGYVLHEEHHRVVLGLDLERAAIYAAAKAILFSESA